MAALANSGRMPGARADVSALTMVFDRTPSFKPRQGIIQLSGDFLKCHNGIELRGVGLVLLTKFFFTTKYGRCVVVLKHFIGVSSFSGPTAGAPAIISCLFRSEPVTRRLDLDMKRKTKTAFRFEYGKKVSLAFTAFFLEAISASGPVASPPVFSRRGPRQLLLLVEDNRRVSERRIFCLPEKPASKPFVRPKRFRQRSRISTFVLHTSRMLGSIQPPVKFFGVQIRVDPVARRAAAPRRSRTGRPAGIVQCIRLCARRPDTKTDFRRMDNANYGRDSLLRNTTNPSAP